jgi:hypothetical protein
MRSGDAARLWLLRAWWPIVPVFALLVVRLVYERACASPYELLPDVTSNSLYAWPLAMLYLGVHCWALTAYLVTAGGAGTLLPGLSAARATWGSHWPKIVFTVAVLALEYSPIPFWRLVGQTVLQCRGGL